MAVYQSQILRKYKNILIFCILVDEFKKQKTKQREKRMSDFAGLSIALPK